MSERRMSERRPIEFQVEVYTLPEQGRKLIEKTVLKDISGTGVCFLSKNPDLYDSGQEVVLDINMPGTDEMDAVMECRANIIRIEGAGHPAEEGSHWVPIGVSMSSLLTFQQREHRDDGSVA